MAALLSPFYFQWICQFLCFPCERGESEPHQIRISLIAEMGVRVLGRPAIDRFNEAAIN